METDNTTLSLLIQSGINVGAAVAKITRSLSVTLFIQRLTEQESR